MHGNNKNKHLENINQSVREGNAAFEEIKAKQAEEFKDLVRQHRLGHNSIKAQLRDIDETSMLVDQDAEEALVNQNKIFKETLGDENNPIYREAADRARQLLGQQVQLEAERQELNSSLLHPIGDYERPKTLSWEEAMALYRQIRAEGDGPEVADVVEGDVTMIDVLQDVDENEQARAKAWRNREGRKRHQEEDPLRTASEDILLYIALNPDVTVTGREIGLEIYNFRDDVGSNPNRRDAAYNAGKLVASSMSAGRGNLAKQAYRLHEEHGLYLQVGKRQFIRDGKVINRAGLNVYRGVSNIEQLPRVEDTRNGKIVYRDVLMDVTLLGEEAYNNAGKETEAPSIDNLETALIDTPVEDLGHPVEAKDDSPEWESGFYEEVVKVIEQMKQDHTFEKDFMSGGAIRAMSSVDIGTRRTRNILLNAKHMKESESKKDGMTREQRVIAILIARWPQLTMARGKDKYNRAVAIVKKAIEEHLDEFEAA